MKKNLAFRFALIMLCFGAVALNSCKKNDTAAPFITVNGGTTIKVSLNSVYNDLGAVANDNVDGTDLVTSDFGPMNPNMDLAGTYTITYNATDNGGNTGHATRTVIVSNDAKGYAANYLVGDNITGKKAGNYTYTVTVVASSTINNQLFLSNFSGLGGSVTVTALITTTGVILSPSSQTPTGMTDPGTISNSSGGAIGTGNKITGFNYKIVYDSGGTDQGVSTWTKL